MGAISSNAASLPPSASDQAPGAVQLTLLKQTMDAQASMVTELLQALPQPAADGRTGGNVDHHA